MSTSQEFTCYSSKESRIMMTLSSHTRKFNETDLRKAISVGKGLPPLSDIAIYKWNASKNCKDGDPIATSDDLVSEFGTVFAYELPTCQPQGQQEQKLEQVADAVVKQGQVLEQVADAVVKQGQVLEMVVGAVATTFIPSPTSYQSQCNPDFRKLLVQRYGEKCIFLSAKFNKAALHGKSRELKGAHIYDHRMRTGAKALGIKLDDPRNGLMLHTTIEDQFDKGNIAIVPVRVNGDGQTTTLRLYVANDISDQEMRWQQDNQMRGLSVTRGKVLHFGCLHLSEATVPSPFLRALLMKQAMAYTQHPDQFPAPSESLLQHCHHAKRQQVQEWLLSWRSVNGIPPEDSSEVPADPEHRVLRGDRKRPRV